MRRQDFTPAALAATACGRRPDPAVTGLTFVNAPSGHKSWSFRRRLPGSTKIRSLKRDYPACSIADAREWATALKEKIERGIDPREEARAKEAHSAMTLEAAHDLYMEVLTRGDRKSLSRAPFRLSRSSSIGTSAQVSDGDGVAVHSFDGDLVTKTRRDIPLAQHRAI